MKSSLKSLAPVGAVVVLALLVAAAPAAPAAAQPTFSKVFSPSQIGPGSHSQLTFTIENGSGSPVTDLAFTDVLPAGVVLATPSGATTDCANPDLTAPDGGGTITLADADLAANATCTIRVYVTSSTPGTHSNVSGDLTSSAGNSGPASDDLEVIADRIAISKAFSPSTIPVNGVSLLTVTLDSSGSGSNTFNVTFGDFLPAGVTIASPLIASHDCSAGSLVASAGADSFSFFGGFLAPGEICSITVEVTASNPGTLLNQTSGSNSSKGTFGFGIATLEVEPPGFLTKSFTDDPVGPGGTVNLEFTLRNLDRDNTATGITFTDDLDAVISGLSAVGTPIAGCGGTLSGSTLLTFSGGSVAPSGICSFSVPVQVPAGTAGGVYVNTTSSVQVTYDSEPVFEPAASDRLVVTEAPVLSKQFLADPVAAGDSVTLRFTITNDTMDAATGISFSDSLAFLGAITATLPSPGDCGGGSTFVLTPPFADPPSTLFVSGASVPANDSCTFDVDINLPDDLTSGPYPNVTSDLSATVGGEPFVGPPAMDVLTVIAAPQLTKEFVSAVLPGDTVDMVFTLTYDENAQGTATGITFTDDLTAVLAGLTAVGTPIAGCGGTISGTTMLTFSGGTLAPDSSCTITVPVMVPAAASPGTFTNTTSDVSATVLATPVISPAASGDLVVAALTLSKQFLPDSAVPGGQMTLRFTIANNSPTGSASDLFFTDSLTTALTGLAAVGPLPMAPCNGTGTLAGTTTLVFTGGSLGPSESCTFDVTVQVPAAATAGQYGNITSSLGATFDGEPVVAPPAVAQFSVIEPLTISKQFLDDPVGPGDTVTLRFTLTNAAPADAATAVAFFDDLDASLAGLAAVGLPMAGCGGTVSGTTDLTFSGGTVAAASSCFFDVTVQVPAAAPFGSYPNATSAVTGTIDGVAFTGNQASDNLIVSIGPAIEKTFLTSPVRVGETTSLQFTVTNTSPNLEATDVAFSDDLDAFLPGVLATLPADGSCGMGSTFTITGTQTLNLTGGTLAAGTSCVFTVDLQLPAGGAAGTFTNTSGAVSATLSGAPQVGNTASDDLLVVAPPVLTKTFLTNPAVAGGTTTLQFTVDNPNPDEALTSIAFSDDLDAALAGLASTSALQNDVCGAGSQVAGTSLVSFSGGTLAGGASCTFSVTVQVPALLPANLAANVTSAPSAQGAGLALTGVAASDDLVLVAPPVISKTFLTNPAVAGGTTTLEFTVENPNPDEALTSIAFSDDLDAALAGLASVSPLQSDVCGSGSQVAGTSVVSLSGGLLLGGASCTFSVTVQVPAVLASNLAANVTSAPTATGAGVPLTGATAGDDLVVVAPPLLAKTFLDNPVAAGATSTLEFTLTNPNPSETLTAIAFSDDLDAALSGLASTSPVQMDVCGAGSQVSGGSVVSFTGGTLAAGASCTFSVTVQVPGGLPLGTVAANVTGAPTANAAGVAVTGEPASDDLRVSSFSFSKAFAGPVIPGGTVVLTFTLTNVDPVNPAMGLGFSDDLDAVIPGLVAIDTPMSDVCGAGSEIAGTSVLTLTGGQLAADSSCSFDVTLMVPDSALFGTFTNTTTQLSSGGVPVADPAEAPLVVERPFPIPTLDAWGLLALVALLAGAAWWRLRRAASLQA